MNESSPPPSAPSPVPPAAQSAAPRRARLWVWVALAAIAIGGVIAYRSLLVSIGELHEQTAQLARDTAPAIAQARRDAQDAQRQVEELRQAVEAMQAERDSLEQLVGDVARMRDEAALIDIERLVTLASAELQISGHVPTALAALQAAQMRLTQVDRPQYLGMRRALERDIEKLRAVPQVDFTGLALKLDQILQSVDGWPLLSEAKHARAATPAKSAPPAAPAGAWDRIRAWVALEFGDLIRIREVETPEALLLSSSQQQLVRERLKLRLLSARQALLARNDRLFRSDLADAQATIRRYFDARAAGPAEALAQLRQVAQTTLAVDVPSLSDSLAALRALRSAPPSKR
ncbi:MAG: uroporphyrinogen-III C-methyltransferase [Gemmatimonadota bacterium]